MNERLLQFIWQYKLFVKTTLNKTVQGDDLQILQVGSINTNAGPDFTASKLKIGNTIWVGDVELHVNASDWHKHKHAENIAYNKVIAHVVYNCDAIILDSLNNEIPTIELKNFINLNLIKHYENLMQQTNAIACHNLIKQVPTIIWHQQIEKMQVERLLQKSANIGNLLLQTENDWSEVFYIAIARSFGTKVNADAFEALATRIPLKIIAKQKSSLIIIEALLFGVSGFLQQASATNEYTKLLKENWEAMQTKYKLVAMDVTRFKMSKMRPANFPTLRIAQFASLIFNSQHLLSKVLAAKLNLQAIKNLFNVQVSDYWKKHFTLKDYEQEGQSEHAIGDTQIESIIINTVVPAIYQYGLHQGTMEYCNYALNLLQQLKPEHNKITKLYTNLNLPNEHAGNSQALIQLFNNYCSVKKCLACSIGYTLIKHQ